MSRKRENTRRDASESSQEARQGGGQSPADETRATEGRDEPRNISDLGPDSSNEPKRGGEVY
jgi:hypothetical protein